MIETLSQRLAALRLPADTPDAGWMPAFRAMADVLLHRAVLRIRETPWRIAEVEFYMRTPLHPDPYVHGDPIQDYTGRWYFHRTAGVYRGGTFKGMDVTFGGEGVNGAALIRAVTPLDGSLGARLDGPCLIVDRVLEITGAASVRALASSFDGTVERPAAGSSPLSVELVETVTEHAIWETPRVGLTLPSPGTSLRGRYVARPYRFVTEPWSMRKGRPHLVVAMHAGGASLSKIIEVSGVAARHAQKYIAAFEAGRKGLSLHGKPGPELLCATFGACWGR